VMSRELLSHPKLIQHERKREFEVKTGEKCLRKKFRSKRELNAFRGITNLRLPGFQTGTLTEEGLDLWGVVPLQEAMLSPGEESRGKPGFAEPIREASQLSSGSLMVGMAACHSLTRIDGELIGDPLDLKVSLGRGIFQHHFLGILSDND